MGRTCVVEACGSEYYPDCGLSFHRFPKDPTLLDPPHPPQSIFEDPHDIKLVKALANSYLNLRLTHNAKLESIKHIRNKKGLRQKLHKTDV